MEKQQKAAPRLTPKNAAASRATTNTKKPLVGSKGFEIVEICSVRRRDIATGRLMPAAHGGKKSEIMYTSDGIRARVSYAYEDSTGEPTRVKVQSFEITKDVKDSLKPADAETKRLFLAGLKELIQEELQRQLERERWAGASRADLAKDRAARGNETKRQNAAARVAKGLPAKAVPDKSKAQNQLETLRARMCELNRQINTTKSTKKLTLKARRSRWQKASKFPSASELR